MDFLNRIFADDLHELFMGSAKRVKELRLMMETQDDKRCPLFKPSVDYVGCCDGIICLDPHNLELIRYDAPALDEFPASFAVSNYLDAHLDPENLATPAWDQLIQSQLPPEIQQYLEAFLARTLYPLRMHDQHKTTPYFKGMSGTGKSTILELVSLWHGRERATDLGENAETTFALGGRGKLGVLAIRDTPKMTTSVLTASNFRLMTSGERIEGAKKHLTTTFSIQWRVPMLCARNMFPSWENTANCMGRRLAMFIFKKIVHEADGEVANTIKGPESATIMWKSIINYKRLLVDQRGLFYDAPWKPQYFRDTDCTYKTQSNEVMSFFFAGTDEERADPKPAKDSNKPWYTYRIEFDRDEVEVLSELKRVYLNWISNTKRGNLRNGLDDEEFWQQLKCEYLPRKNFTKDCPLELAGGVCNHANKAEVHGRVKREAVSGLKLIRIEMPDDTLE
ncbi:hypothetical protein HDU89_006775 [Geranomyces variabilis]|nr:hypothetical protein HDU89_006775 [Geranomyces variabilis]